MEPTGKPELADERRSIQFHVRLEGEPASDLEVVGYAFDSAGNFLDSARLENEQLQLRLPNSKVRRARIFFGPPLPKTQREQPLTIELMRKLNAYEAAWTPQRLREPQELLPVPERLWRYWLLCWCRIRGQVVRSVSLGGTTNDLPVCHARVHICEVDRLPWFILQLPDDLIWRLRDELLIELQRPFPRPGPFPDPPFSIDPGFIDPSPENIARRADLQARGAQLSELTTANDLGGIKQRLDRGALNPQPLPPRGTALNPQPEPAGLVALAALPSTTRAALASSSLNIVKQALVSNLDLIRPFLCLWPWFWWRYRCDEIAVVETNAHGRFDTTIWYLCGGDQPDLYFWVEYFIGGTWTTVYHPPIACNTYWNYACGSDVTIRVTDPRVPVCGDPPDLAGKQVIVMGIGENVSMHEIQGAAAGANEGLTTGGSPFGGVLEPRVQFGRTALFAANITHYRWSYRRLTLGDGVTSVSDPDWHQLDDSVVRHYMLIDPTPPDFPVSFPAEPMGPDPAFPGLNLFKIQPLAPSVPSEGWALVDSHQDNASAFFKTHLLSESNVAAAAGKYELKLELFKADGSLVDMTAEGILLKMPNIDAPFGSGTVSTIAATPEHLITDPGTGHVMAFRMVLRIDNNVCHGTIYDVLVNSAAAGPCGFLDYPAGMAAATDAHISFLAMHPHNFATFTFDVARGSSGEVGPASADGPVGVPNDGFTVTSAGVYEKDVSVATLLNTPPTTPPCTRGAFAAHLHVRATATDGWYTLTYLDAPRPGENGLTAFALAPTP